MIRKSRQTNSLGKSLTLPLGLVNERKIRLFQSCTYALCVLAVATVIWSAMVEFREVAVARGQIVPSNATQKVQHLEGGIVDALFVAEGDMVAKGQALMQLRPETAGSDLEQLEAHLAGLAMQHMRLEALTTGAKLDFAGFGNRYAGVQREQFELYTRTLAKDARERENLRLEVQQIEAELATVTHERESLVRQAGFEAEQASIRQKSFAMGTTSRLVYLEAQSRLEALRAKVASTEGKIVQLNSKAEETRHALDKADADRLQKLADERSKVTDELSEKRYTMEKFRDRVSRLVVRSPEAGTVHLLAQRTPGEVIKPGDLVAEIISVQADMIAEVHMQVKDIGHVKLGDPANIKVSNYDPTGLELATGHVVDISATTFEAKDGQPYYRVRIKLDRAYIGPRERDWRLLPGMVVEADIVTGAKSLMRYMLKPVYRSLDSAFAER